MESGMNRGPERFAPLAGVVFFVLVFVAFAVLGNGSPEPDAATDTVASFYRANAVKQALSAYALILAVPFLVIFVSALRTRLAEIEAPKTWRHLAFAGGLIAATGFLASAATVVALTDAARNHFPPLVMQGMNTLSADSFPIFVAGLGIMSLGSAGGVLGGAGLPRWLGWLALAIGIACFIPYVSILGFIASAIWTVIASVALFRANAPDRQTDGASPAN